MKKLFCYILTICLALSLTACVDLFENVSDLTDGTTEATTQSTLPSEDHPSIPAPDTDPGGFGPVF